MMHKDAKYDPDLEAQIRWWINEVVDEQVLKPEPDQKDFQESMKSGEILCKLANVMGGAIKSNSSKMAFKMMENIGKFLDFADQLGVPKTDIFQTVDLYEGQNIPAVISGLHAFARKAYSSGKPVPQLGPKEATANKREFTEEQLKEGQHVIGLQMGTNKLASQAGDHFGRPRQINAKYDKEIESHAKQWIELVIGEQVEWGTEDDTPGSAFADGLKSGEVLCKLANKLQPGAVKMNVTSKVSNPAMRANKEKENIEKFLTFCETYGVRDRFSTPYLYQKQNIMAVVNTICQLGSTAQSKGYDGPVLGPKIAEKNERGFSEEQVKASREGHIGMQAGTNKLASQSGQNFGLGRQIAGAGAQSDYDPYK
ncbi:Transgelin-2 [Acropora cervicornis]|uniref:Transgelin n=1 Tax=Acropora cervicornis TaxID=6130 RepID=A0AAD9VDN0_ACRCE|nr:Transgelin-2 [Acropora cervicornis]